MSSEIAGGSAEDNSRSGTLIVLVGPSGAGKNSLMAYAREQFDADPTVLFVRRAITRRAFLATQAAGLFAVA